MKAYFSLRSLVVFLVAASSTCGDNLVARRLRSSLPSPMCLMAPYYDGESDFIYLVGGRTDNRKSDSILRLDISTDTIELVGSLPKTSWLSPLEADSAGNLVYFDGQNSPYEIYKFDTVNNSVSVIGTFSVGASNSASSKNSEGKVLLFGSRMRRDIWGFNIDSESVQSEIVGRFPPEYFSSSYATAVKVATDKALMFGDGLSASYVELDLETLEHKQANVDSFPRFQEGMTATSDLNYVYLFGGDYSGVGLAADGIIQLDPIAQSWTYFQVDDFPFLDGFHFEYAPEVVWVEKLNRIYMFGGQLSDIRDLFLDGIYYIDLDPLTPTTTTPTITTTEELPPTTYDPELFSCVDRTDGTHPHPTDCSKYIACRNGTLEGVHPCPSPLLYDPTTGNCNLPSLVNCELTCENKEDGTYPHPQECRLFIICSNRELFVFWCDPPLLFDPQELRCTLPELVQCEFLSENVNAS